jgi:hypothetical protein
LSAGGQEGAIHIDGFQANLGMHDLGLRDQDYEKTEQVGRSVALIGMERMSSHCHAVIGEEARDDWCPACGEAIVERTVRDALKI